MISCLFDYIGLLEITTPSSGVYLNRLQGIETSQLDAIRKEETYNIEDAWDDIQNRAIQEMEQRLNEWGAKYFKNRSNLLNVLTGQYENDTTVSAGNTYAGWLFNGYGQYYKNLELTIPEVHLYSTNTISSDITIFNAATGDILDTISHDFIEDTVNRIYIGKSYPTWKYPKIFIAYDESEVNTITADNLLYNVTYETREGRVNKGSQVVSKNITGAGSQGLIVTYNLKCSWDNWLCQRQELFLTPFLYLLGYEFCQERLYSDRINRYTLLRRERATELAANFLERFNAQMDEILNGLNVDLINDICFRCEREVNYRTQMP